MIKIINFLNIQFSSLLDAMQFKRKDRNSKTKEQYFIPRHIPGNSAFSLSIYTPRQLNW
jgi:hypothetical protein